VLKDTCCAQYTIRCEALNFTLTRSQKKVMKRMKHFLNTGEKPKKLRHFAVAGDGSGDIKHERKVTSVVADKKSTQLPSDHLVKHETVGHQTTAQRPTVKATEKSDPDLGQPSKVKDVTALSPRSCQKAKFKRMERAKLRAKQRTEKGLPAIPSKVKVNRRKTIEDYVKETASSAKHKLEVCD
jgi:arginine-tRNA-protein transferase